MNAFKYELIVDEPWNFNHNGSNVLHGVVVKQFSPTFLLFKSDNLLSCQGKESHILILKPRYEKEAFDLESDDEIVVGGALYLKDEYEGEDEKYLMLHRTKKENDINKDKWIGVGGHAEGNESPEECLLREVKEETGLELLSYKFRGLITFVSDDCEPEMMCLFTSDDFRGEIITCDEGELEWVSKTEVPKLPTWEGDAIFLKLLLDNEERFFTLKLVYKNEKLVEKAVQIY